MFRADHYSTLPNKAVARNPMVIGLGIMLFAAVVGFFVLFGFEITIGAMERPYLAPWVLATGFVLLAPLFYLYRRGELTLVNPLVFLTLTYLFPVFFLGGWSLVFGTSTYYYLSYVDDPEWNFPLTFAYIIVALASLWLGFLVPYGKRAGKRVGNWLPAWDFSTNELLVLGVGFLGVGVFLLSTAIGAGTIGYQALDNDTVREIGSSGAFFAIIYPASTMFLWIAFFRMDGWSVKRSAVLLILVLATIFAGVSTAARAGMIGSIFGAILAYVIVKRKDFSPRQWLLIAVTSLVVMFAGTEYANTFREKKGTVVRVTAEEYYQVAVDSVFSLGNRDLGTQFEEFTNFILERLEIASSFAVVVSNHEMLSVYEQSYGLDNNILRSTWMGFIPRFVWSDKPVVADARAFNELYLDSEWNGFSITVMGDLLRNFGPVGIPLGMFALGFLLRFIYAGLLEGFNYLSWKGVLFYVVLLRINLESFYGNILPGMIRVLFVIGIQIALMRIVVLLYRKLRRAP